MKKPMLLEDVKHGQVTFIDNFPEYAEDFASRVRRLPMDKMRIFLQLYSEVMPEILSMEAVKDFIEEEKKRRKEDESGDL
jgi:hypothetical protein